MTTHSGPRKESKTLLPKDEVGHEEQQPKSYPSYVITKQLDKLINGLLYPERLFLMLCYAMLCYAKSLQSCSTLCDPTDGSPPGSPVPGILQARTLEKLAKMVKSAFSEWWKLNKSL